MVSHLRQQFNHAFTEAQHTAFTNHLNALYGSPCKFRVAETPVFVSREFKTKLLQGCEEIFDVLVQPEFRQRTEGAITSAAHLVPNETDKPLFIQVDFGVCRDDDGELMPQLIEIQGFPSLYNFQVGLADSYRAIFDIPADYATTFAGLDNQGYISLLRNAILAGHPPKHVVLLEVEPEKQGTNIDFYAAAQQLGIKVLDLQDVRRRGNRLFYFDENDARVRIKRIYNRVIFDELDQRTDLKLSFKFTDNVDVEWAGHPNWFFRLSKYSLPLFKSRFVPETHFLSDLSAWPDDLTKYVLKPLFSFAGQGVKINVSREDLDSIAVERRGDYILQQKVAYAPVVETPDGPAKCEIRMMALWLPEWPRPCVVNNICRLSKGEMVGVRYNKDKTWVGGTVCFFEP